MGSEFLRRIMREIRHLNVVGAALVARKVSKQAESVTLVRVIRETQHLDYLDGWRGISILEHDQTGKHFATLYGNSG